MMRALLAIVAFLPLAAAAQPMYKWVDEKGTTHFSEYPPPEGKGAKIEVKPPAADTKYDPGSWREREKASRERDAKRAVANDNARKRDEATRAQDCRRARQALDTVKNSRRVYDLNDKGERVYLEDKDRPAAIDKWTREVERSCR